VATRVALIIRGTTEERLGLGAASSYLVRRKEGRDSRLIVVRVDKEFKLLTCHIVRLSRQKYTGNCEIKGRLLTLSEID
jgi:hypothetical protein